MPAPDEESVKPVKSDQSEDSDQTTKPSDKSYWYDLSLIQAVMVAIFMAGAIVGVAELLYLGNNNHKYDISRPGNKYNPPKLTIDNNTDIDSNSPVTKDSLSNMTKMINDQRKKLKSYGNYSDPVLNSGGLDFNSKNPDTSKDR